jgi:hypothetical protein
MPTEKGLSRSPESITDGNLRSRVLTGDRPTGKLHLAKYGEGRHQSMLPPTHVHSEIALKINDLR